MSEMRLVSLSEVHLRVETIAELECDNTSCPVVIRCNARGEAPLINNVWVLAMTRGWQYLPEESSIICAECAKGKS